MKIFCEIEESTGVVLGVLRTHAKPIYPVGRIGVEVLDYNTDYLGGHYNGTTVDKCPAGKVWDVATNSFIAA